MYILSPSVVKAMQLNDLSEFLYSPGSQYSQVSPRLTRNITPSACHEPTQLRLWVSEVRCTRVPWGQFPRLMVTWTFYMKVSVMVITSGT